MKHSSILALLALLIPGLAGAQGGLMVTNRRVTLYRLK